MIHNIALIGMFVVVCLVFWGLFQEWRDEQFGEVWQAADWPLRDAMDLARFTGHPEADHFEDVLDMVEIGSGAKRQVTDIRLPRYACYLIVQNGDQASAFMIEHRSVSDVAS